MLPFSHFISNSIAPQTLVTLLFPYLMGADYTTHHAVPYFGSAQMVVTAAYVGILPLMLAAAALTLCKASRIVRTSAASAVAAAIFSFGGFTPLGRLLYHTPVFNFFRDHRVNIIFFAFAVATMACHAVGHLEFMSPERRRALTILVPAGLLLLAVGLLIKVRAILGLGEPAHRALPSAVGVPAASVHAFRQSRHDSGVADNAGGDRDLLAAGEESHQSDGRADCGGLRRC